MKNALLVLFLILTSQNLLAAESSNQRDRNSEILANLQAAANSGNQKAQIYLAHVYLKGFHGILVDIDKGMQMLEAVGQKGDPELQEYIGQLYYFGEYGKVDLVKALSWFKKAADKNQAIAMDFIGIFYSAGLGGVEKDCGQSIDWFNKAMAHGYQGSKRNLVWLYATCSNEKYRDGEKALRMALEMLKDAKKPTAGLVDNLAAAYAETGQFKLAIKHQIEALKLLGKEASERRVKQFQQRLELYRANKQWRGSSYALDNI